MRIKDLISRSKALIEGNVYLAVDDATNNVTQKVDYKTLAQEIIEQYNLSTLAGSAQSVKAALDGLNNTNVYVNSITTLNNALNAVQAPRGTLVQAYSNEVVNVLAGETLSGKNNMKAWFSRQSSTAYMYTMNVMDTEYTYTGVYNPTTSTASKIVKEPTRAEVDALSANDNISKITTSLTDYVDALPNNTHANLWNSAGDGATVGSPTGITYPMYYRVRKINSTTAVIEASVMGNGAGIENTYIKQKYGSGGWSEWKQSVTVEDITTLASSYGTLTYKCYKTGKLVSVVATLVTTQEVPASSQLVEGLPYFGQTVNYSAVTIFDNTSKEFINVNLCRTGTTGCALFTRTVVPSGASLRMNFVYTTD